MTAVQALAANAAWKEVCTRAAAVDSRSASAIRNFFAGGFDAWRVRADAPAVAFVRGNPKLKTALKFVRFEPYVIPKPTLTGSSTERTDMRVLQVIYSFPHANLPVYVGQEMDAFIKAPPADGSLAHPGGGKS